MTIATFGVTAAIIQTDYFSQLGGFSTETNPSAVSIARYIQQKGAELGGKLRAESQVPATIELDSTTEAYLWCQETLCLQVALRIAQDMMQSPPPLAKAWQEQLDARFTALASNAVGTLGDGAATPTEEPDGPTTHIDDLSLDMGDAADSSNVIPPFRKSDLL